MGLLESTSVELGDGSIGQGVDPPRLQPLRSGEVMGTFSVAMSESKYQGLRHQLLRDDGQEDLAFFLWHPSVGDRRSSALVSQIVSPLDGERHIHGNVAFESGYFLRASAMAERAGAGLGLVHTHPRASGWQGMSQDDVRAEAGHAKQALALTNQPLVGLTLAGEDGAISARRWLVSASRDPLREDATHVRVVGDELRLFTTCFKDLDYRRQRRTIDSWGETAQRRLASLNVVVAGAGSVGALVVEALARTGFSRVTVLDYDRVQMHNLDRLLHATRWDAAMGRFKADIAVQAAKRAATHPAALFDGHRYSVIEAAGLGRLKDADLIFSCVDRPAARAALNALAYAHLIPVVDGGVMVDPGRGRMRGAEWRAHVAAPGRRCLQCLGQYDPALVQADRDGFLDNPSYLRSLPKEHVLRRGENVFAFSSAAASHMVLAALRMIIAPAGVADVGAELGHFSTGTVDLQVGECDDYCQFPSLIAKGDDAGRPIPCRHIPAEKERGRRDLVDLIRRFSGRLDR